MDINNSINLPNPFPRKTEEKYPFFPNKKILAKLKLNRNFKLNKLNISAHKETEKIREYIYYLIILGFRKVNRIIERITPCM